MHPGNQANSLFKCSDSDYFALPFISKSSLDLLNKSPANYKYWLGKDREQTKAMALGSAVHCAVLEPERFAETYVKAPDVDRRTSAGKAEWVAALRVNAGKLMLAPEDYETCLLMMQAVRSHPICSWVLAEGEAEMACVWKPGVDEVISKAKIDFLSTDYLVELKTTESAHPEAFAKSVISYRYHVQLAYYLDGLGIAAPQRKVKPIVIAVESRPPYHVSVFTPSSEMLSVGRSEYQKNLETYAKCLRENHWPGYPCEMRELSLPAWYGRAAS